MTDETANLKEVILNTRKPIVLKNSKNNWQCFQNLNFAQYCEKLHNHLDKNPLLFEKASQKWDSSPQWERFREHESITVQNFTEAKQKDSEFWYSYSYKGLNEIPELARNGIDFAFLGFPNIIDNIFFWLSSKGGHTPCHYDSYSCNIVVQVYGVKKWLLFPPEADLSVTRVPYEESSIYCYENFYSPSKLKAEELSKLNCRKVELRPGDILIVPRNWWHYVETLETALSINFWLPLECDRTAQIDECIVKFIIESVFLKSDNEDKDNFLNPNQFDQIMRSEDLMGILQSLLHGSEEAMKYPYQYLDEEKVSDLQEKCGAEIVPVLQNSDFLDLLTRNSCERNRENQHKSIHLKEMLLNAICNPESIRNIRVKLLKNFK